MSDAVSLAEAVSNAVGGPILALEDVRSDELAYDAFLAGRRVIRTRGVAVTLGERRRWSLIEKVTDGPAVASAYLRDNALRERRAYESGLVGDLAPGVAAPRCLAINERPDGTLTLRLEDVEVTARRASAGDIVAVAGDLGGLAARWVDRVPTHDWLFRGWLDRHGQPEAVEPALGRLRSLRSAQRVERRLGWTIARGIDLIENQELYRAVLRGLPETLCHHDAVAANVFRRQNGDVVETILIDWESVGPGPVGADLASLLFASARRGDIPAATVSASLELALEAYGRGMREGGASVDASLLRLGVQAAISLRWTLLRDVALALDEGNSAFRGSAPSESSADSLAELIELSDVLFRSAEAARAGASG